MNFESPSQLPDGFCPADPVSVRQILTRLKASSPHDPRSAAAWFDLFCRTSDAITDHQTALELRAACHEGDPAQAEELSRFDRDIVGLLLDGRQTLIRIYLESPWQKAMHADDHGRLARDLTRRLRTSDARLTGLQLKENTLIREYRAFVHNARARFLDNDIMLSIVVGKMNDRSEDLRRMAYQSFWRFVRDNRGRYAQLFEELAALRKQQARIAEAESYESFVYEDMGRDFTPQDTRRLCESIAKHIVPVVTRLSRQQSTAPQEPGGALTYPWNARIWQQHYPAELPCGGEQAKFVQQFEQCLNRLHPVFTSCYRALQSTHGFDIFPRAGKAPGAFCALRPTLGVPFVFGNFSVSARDLFSLFHEFGHAVHGYCAAPIQNTLLRSPGLDYCEFVSTTFEFLAHLVLDCFWTDIRHARQASAFHLFHSVAFLPFAAQLDEWQSLIYDNPSEADSLWTRLSDKYRPHLNWSWGPAGREGEGEATKGLGWCSRPHVFSTPFYYIDYAIAQISAWQIYAKVQAGGATRQKTIDALVGTLFTGGQRSSLELLAAAGCASPFEDETVAAVAKQIETTFEALN